MFAKLFGAVGAIETLVCICGKALGADLVGYFPTNEQYHGDNKEGCGEPMPENKHKGREHHREIPVVYTAVRAAAVAQKPSVEGAEKENADHVAYAVGKADEYKYSAVEHIGHVKDTEYHIQGYPCGGAYKCTPPRNVFDLLSSRGLVITLELLLTAHAFVSGGKEAQYHFDEVNDPHDHKQKCLGTQGKFVQIKMLPL